MFSEFNHINQQMEDHSLQFIYNISPNKQRQFVSYCQKQNQQPPLNENEKELKVLYYWRQKIDKNQSTFTWKHRLDFFSRYGSQLISHHFYEEAIPALNQARKFCTFNNFIHSHKTIIFQLIYAYSKVKNIEQATNLIELFDQLSAKANQEESLRKSAIHNNIGFAYHLNCRHSMALQLYTKAESILVKQYGLYHYGVAIININRAEIYKTQYKYCKAQKFLDYVANILEVLEAKKKAEPILKLKVTFMRAQMSYQKNQYFVCLDNVQKFFTKAQKVQKIKTVQQWWNTAVQWMVFIAQSNLLDVIVYQKALKIVDQFWPSSDTLLVKQILKSKSIGCK